jgi:hypothetical protein
VTALSRSASVYLGVLRFAHANFIPPMLQYSPSKSNDVSEIGERFDRKVLLFFFYGTCEVRAEAEETVEHQESDIIDCRL